MKKISMIILAAALLASPVMAESNRPYTPAQVAGSLTVAMTIGAVVVLGATLTGTKPELCAKMGGTYIPTTDLSEQCPDGKWANLL